MDPVSVIVTAIASGAAAGLKPTAEKFIKDAYEGIKALIKRKYSNKVNIELLDSDPASKLKQEVVKEDLDKVAAGDDTELLTQAKEILELVKQHAPDVTETIGVKLEEIEGGILTIENIISSGDGVLVNKARIEGEIKISGVRAGVKETEPPPRTAEACAGAGPAAAKHTADVELDNVNAGGDINIITQQYMVARGVIPYQDYLDGVLVPEDLANQGTVEVDELRKKLLRIDRFPNPILVTVSGTLFPCALLTAGWWDRQEVTRTVEPKWHDNIQKWLFHGFDLWGPSWDFTWDEENMDKPYVIAQLGSGDEADSIPVLIPRDKANRLQEFFHEKWGGGEVEVTALLGHRRQFASVHKDVELVGGLLDYCLWIDADNKNHGIAELDYQTLVYSGYLWKCVTPKAWYESNKILSLNQVYFIWEHTNFRDHDAILYNLDSLTHKEEYLTKLYGEMVLLQKSSPLVPGIPFWSTNRFYEVFKQKKKKIIF